MLKAVRDIGPIIGRALSKLPTKAEDRISLAFIIITIVLAFSLTAAISITLGKPVGNDIRYHMKVAEAYARFENALFDEAFWGPAGGPYLSELHFILVPFVWAGVAIPFAALLQAFFYPLALSASVFLVWKRYGIGPASYAGIILLSSLAFFDRAMQVNPQAFDMIFFPLAVYFFMAKRRIPFLISMSMVVYSHPGFGLLLLCPILLYHVKSKTGGVMVRDILIVSIPMILLTAAFISPHIELVGGISTYQEEILIEQPLLIFIYIGLLPVAVCGASLAYLCMGRGKLGDFDFLTLIWLVVLTVLIPIYPDRYPTYAIVPMSILGSRLLGEADRHGSHAALALRVLLLLLASVNYLGWWLQLWGYSPYMFDV